MDKTLRSILWLLVALVIFSSFSTGWFFVAKERLYDDYVNLENLFKTSMEKLNRELASSQEKNKDLELKLAAAEKELSALESSNENLTSKYETLLEDRDVLNKELARVKKGKFFLEKKIREVESDKFTAGLLKDKTFLEVELGRLKDSLAPKDLEIEGLKAENRDLSAGFAEFLEEKDVLEEKIRDSEMVAEILSKDLLKEKTRAEKDKEDFKRAKIDNRFLKTRIAELEKNAVSFDKLLTERDDLKLKIASLEKDMEYKNQEISGMETALNSRERRAEEYRAEAYHSPQEVDLPPIVLERARYGAEEVSASSFDLMNKDSSLRGRIVTVNREHSFVVIDLGKQRDVEIGTMFEVYRGSTLIGRLKTIQCRQRISACDIIDIKEGYYVEIDDVVAKR
ncbi:MAG: hypothetical protein HQ532_03025 [Candidatus Omnitrophica bacterium]|nr:hypothetical protein [Candidatus Omnitrophota bacterium]